MAAQVVDEVEAPAAAGGSGLKRKIVIIAVVALVAGGGGFAAMRLFAAPPADAAVDSEPTEEPVVEGAVIDVAEMNATLDGDPPHLARIGLAVVLSESADETVVAGRFPVLRDAAVSELARSSADELVTAAGVDSLRDRLTARAGDVYPEGDVLRVLITELVVQ